MASRKWSVWSLVDASIGRWLEVGEGMTRTEAYIAVAAKERAAAKYGITSARYVALPEGRKPR